MTDTATQPATAPSAARVAASWFKRWQFWLLLLVLGALAAAASQLFAADDEQRYGLDSTALDGYGAMAAVLESEGVGIHRAHTLNDATELASEHPQATLVVFQRDMNLPEEFWEHLDTFEDLDVVLHGIPGWQLTDHTNELIGAAGELPGGGAGTGTVVEAGETCRIPSASAAESIRAEGSLYALDEDAGPAGSSAHGCFTLQADDAPDGHAVVEFETDELSALAIGTPSAFTNSNITAEGNAALALWSFGQNEDLIWYTPSEFEHLGEEEWATPWDYMPDWVTPLGWWLLICGLVFMIVAGKRHGPVISEPLPVQVPASESAEGRGRLYQQANAVAASARALRSAHMLRLARLLRLGPRPAETVVFDAVARQTGARSADVAQLLNPSRVTSNSELVGFAQQLAELEDDVRLRLGQSTRYAPSRHATPRHTEGTAQ